MRNEILYYQVRECVSECDRLASLIESRSKEHMVETIHSSRRQEDRETANKAFRNGIVNVLIGTDVLARGLDYSKVAFVFIFNMPDTAETWIHRVGRTGRAGAEGSAITFCRPNDHNALVSLEKVLQNTISISSGGTFPDSYYNVLRHYDNSHSMDSGDAYQTRQNGRRGQRRTNGTGYSGPHGNYRESRYGGTNGRNNYRDRGFARYTEGGTGSAQWHTESNRSDGWNGGSAEGEGWNSGNFGGGGWNSNRTVDDNRADQREYQTSETEGAPESKPDIRVFNKQTDQIDQPTDESQLITKIG